MVLSDPEIGYGAELAAKMMDRATLIEAASNLLRVEDPGLRRNAVWALAALNEAAPDELVLAALGDTDAEIRCMVLSLLVPLSKNMPRAATLALLEDEDGSTRLEAARALSRRGEQAGLAVFRSRMHADDEFERENALTFLLSGYDAKVAGRGVARYLQEDLLSLLCDEYWPASLQAAELLGLLGADAPIEAIVTLLREDDAATKQGALMALKEIGDRSPINSELVGLILPLIAHEDAEIRRAAAAALEQFGNRVPAEAFPRLPARRGTPCDSGVLDDRVPLQPTAEQERELEHVLGRCRRLDNTALAQRITAYRRCGVTLTGSQQHAELPHLKAAFPEYAAIHSQVVQEVLARLDKT